MAMKREIGIVGLTFIGVGGVIGSGWLFAPMNAAKLAGPAAILAWVICGVVFLLLALTYAEVCGRLPVPGGLARLPFFTHGRLVAAAMGWTAWVGYLTTAPIETVVMLRYLAEPFPWLQSSDADHNLSAAGVGVAVVLLVLMTVLNAFGVALFARINSTLTWVKIFIPLLIAGLFIADRVTVANFTSAPSFMPMGWQGVLSAIATGGVVFAFVGFRHAIDMAGEVKRPQITIPLGLAFSVLICLVIYMGLQVAFIGALSAENLAHGWDNLAIGHSLGPLGALALGLGMVWLSVFILAGAVIAPFGGALISTGSNARIGLALAHNGFFPILFTRLSGRLVPLNALVLNLVIGVLAVLFVPFSELLALNGAALVFSLAIGPVTLLALRRQDRHGRGTFRLPWAGPVCFITFTASTLIVYWSGWDTMWRLALALLVGAVLFFTMHRLRGGHAPEAKPALWLLPYFGGLMLLSWLGSFGGGRGIIPFGWDIAVGVALSAVCLALAVRYRLPDAIAAKHRGEHVDEAAV
jgi:amino acid transporter